MFTFQTQLSRFIKVRKYLSSILLIFLKSVHCTYNTPEQKCKNIVKCKLTYHFSFHGKKCYH